MPISPNQGSTTGHTAVHITGTNLSGVSAVHFGANLGTNIRNNTPTALDVDSPPGSGVVGLTVTTSGGTSGPTSYFYIDPPIKTSISPTSGPTAGGNSAVLSGAHLTTATAVNFGANAGTVTGTTDSSVTATVPAGGAPGAVSVTVTTAAGTVDSLTYTYVDPPTVITVAPNTGSTDGGTTATVTGTNLATTAGVTVGGVAASFGVVSDIVIIIIIPAGAAGAADVVVTTTGGSATVTGGFTYVAGPGI